MIERSKPWRTEGRMARAQKNSVTLSQDNKLQEIFDKYPGQEESLIEILHDIQFSFRYLPKEAMPLVAKYCHVPLSRVMSVATFYTAFSFEKKGDTMLKVCLGTTCHVKGAWLILEEIKKALGITAGQTTADGKFSLEVVNCVGACAMAPVVIENNKYHGKFKIVDVSRLLGKQK